MKSVLVTATAARPDSRSIPASDLESELPAGVQLLTVKETAKYLRCTIDHVYHLIDEGALTGENHALKTEGLTPTGRTRQRYIRVHRQSAINLRKRRTISS